MAEITAAGRYPAVSGRYHAAQALLEGLLALPSDRKSDRMERQTAGLVGGVASAATSEVESGCLRDSSNDRRAFRALEVFSFRVKL